MTHDTFHWHVKPEEIPVTGTVYPDGSLLDNFAPELGRTGWAAVVMHEGKVVAAAYGVPPRWAKGIEGAEAWALLQSTRFTLPAESQYWPDCLPLRTMVARGKAAAVDPKNKLARIHAMILPAFDELDPGQKVGWMPAHLKKIRGGHHY